MATVQCDPVLSIKSLSKRFGGTQAVNAVSFDVFSGEIVALLGENGAGKSTLIKMLAGVYSIDEGSIALSGHAIGRNEKAIAFIHQDLGLIDWMTVAENIAFTTGYPRRFGLIDWAAIERIAREALARVDCDLDPRRPVFSLSRTEKSLLAIARALWVRPDLLVLDEPTASLPAHDVRRLFEVLIQLRAEGMAMIYVSHRLDEVKALCDRAVVMRDGKLVAITDARTTDEAELVEHIVGKHVAIERTVAGKPGEIRLKVQGLSAAFAGPVDFEVRSGEIVGLVGLRGGGQDLVARTIFGAFPRNGGGIEICGKPIAPTCPQEAIRAGIGFVGAERIEENLGRGMTLAENMFINPSLDGGLVRRLDRTTEKTKAHALIRMLDIRPAAPHALIEDLSGGNQQKVVLARWMHANKPVLILEEPTAGVDVGAKSEIYRLLRDLAAKGTAIVVVSTDFEEVANLCGRALVFARGRIVDETSGDEITPMRLLASASGSDPVSASMVASSAAA